jgi:radical SAM superfamily enzyme YgiQ (UPF0313 family)
LIGNNIKKALHLFQLINELKEKSEDEYDFMGEIIPKNITKTAVKEMAMAGLTVQIGYEAISDGILEKMNKQSRFIDLLFFIKHAQQFGLKVIGANILTNSPGETEEDILEAIDNLPFLRFFLGEQSFEHNHSVLYINSRTTFFKEMDKAQKQYWSYNKTSSLLPDEFFHDIDRFDIFSYELTFKKNPDLWERFKLMSNYYTNNRFYYKILNKDKKNYYHEYCNGELIKSIHFDNPKYVDVLAMADDIISIDDLHTKL